MMRNRWQVTIANQEAGYVITGRAPTRLQAMQAALIEAKNASLHFSGELSLALWDQFYLAVGNMECHGYSSYQRWPTGKVPTYVELRDLRV